VGPPYHNPDALEILGAGEVNRPLPWEALTPEQRKFQIEKMAIHAAMIESMDQQVGRILAQLEAMGVVDDTLVLFASDNGASAEIMVRGEGHDPLAPPGSRKTFVCLGPGWSSCANTPFRRHKTWVHEGGIATPWIVHWPRGVSAKGELRTQPVHVIDVVPTVLELAGIEHGRATRQGLNVGTTVVPVSVVKGLELDGVVVVEPAAIVHAESQGLRALYVALTRSTRRLTVVHAEVLPPSMR
jgi:arylsulfatase